MISQRRFNTVQKLALSGAVIALYVTVMQAFGWFAFMQHQIRLATALYSIAAFYPFLIIPLGLANMLSNLLLGPLGVLDVVGGFAAGIITSALVYLISKYKLSVVLIALPIILVPGLLVPVWLSFLLGVPYPVLAADLCAGQIVPGILGVVIAVSLKRINFFE